MSLSQKKVEGISNHVQSLTGSFVFVFFLVYHILPPEMLSCFFNRSSTAATLILSRTRIFKIDFKYVASAYFTVTAYPLKLKSSSGSFTQCQVPIRLFEAFF